MDVIDYWVICDTGSTDGTQSIIRNRLAGVPGELHEDTWCDFGHNRSLSLTRARGKAEYLLMINADETLSLHPALPQRLTADAYLIRFEGPTDYALPLLIRGDIEWCFKGVTHEYLDSPRPATYAHLPSARIRHHFDGGMRWAKYDRDIRALTQALEEDPTNSRYMFYLAQSFRDVGLGYQALGWYQKRAAAGDGTEEAWYAAYQVARLAEESAAPWVTVLEAYLRAFARRPSRLEPILPIVRHYRQSGQYDLALFFASFHERTPYPDDILFIERSVYTYEMALEQVLCYELLGHPDLAFTALERIRLDDWVPATVRGVLTKLRERLSSSPCPYPHGREDQESPPPLACSLRELETLRSPS